MTAKYKMSIITTDDAACQSCGLRAHWSKGRCQQADFKRYTREDAGTVERPDLLVVADAPSTADEDSFWHDDDGQAQLRRLKEMGLAEFIVAPAVRCHPGGTIDHFTMRKQYKSNSGYQKRATPLENATAALPQCSTYVRELIAAIDPRMTLAMGPLATEALKLEGTVQQLRTLPLHPKVQLKFLKLTEGTVVTHDRFMARKNPWAAIEQVNDFDKLQSLIETGFARPQARKDNIETHVLDTVDKVTAFVDWVLTADFGEGELLAFDFETKNLLLSKEHNKLLNVGFARRLDEDTAWVIPLAHPESPFSPEELEIVFDQMRRLFASVGARFFGWLAHFAQFDVAMAHLFLDVWVGEEGGKPVLDTVIMSHLCDENRKYAIKSPNALETLASELLGFSWYAESKMKAKRDHLDEVSIDSLNEYVGVDAVMTARVCNALLERASAEDFGEDLLRLCVHLYSPAILFTSEMRESGQAIDVDLLCKLRGNDSTIVQRLAEIRELFARAPEVAEAMAIVNASGGRKRSGFSAFKVGGDVAFSLDSPEHKKALFDQVLELEGADESTDKNFQERHKGVPLVALYHEYQALATLDKLYLEPIATYLQSPNSLDGRLRPYFNFIQTVTGRLSATNPNSQQSPRGDTKDKKQIKALVQAATDSILIQLDFSQAEVRWLGILSGDRALAAKYQLAAELEAELRADPSNEVVRRRLKVEGDLHMSTALQMYRLPLDLPFTNEKEAKLARQKAKTICFGLIYGKTVKSLAKDLGMDEDEAQEAVDLWLGQFPEAAEWLQSMEETARNDGFVRSPFGRRRRLPEARSDDMSIANRASRQARNTPIQSAASDMCLICSCETRKQLRQSADPELRQVKLINTVHDSLTAEMRAEFAVVKAYAELAKGVFTDPMLLKRVWGIDITVPLACDFDIGPNQGNMLDYDFTDRSLYRALHDSKVLRAQPAGTVFSDLKGKRLLFDEVQ